MAIGTPAVLKDNGAITTSAQTTVAVSGVVIPAGTLVSVMVALGNNGTAVGDPSTVSDGTNNYVKDDTSTRASTVYESEWRFYDAVGGTRTITVTLPASANYTHVVVTGVSGADSVAPLDEIGGGDQGGTTAVSIVSVSTIDQADEASIVGLNWSSATAMTLWPPTGYTSLVNTTNATRSMSHAVAYKTPLTAGGSETATATLGATANWAGTMGTYKGAATAAAPPVSLPQPLLMMLNPWRGSFRGPPILTVPVPQTPAVTTTPVSLTLDAPIEAAQGVALTGTDQLESAASVSTSAVDPVDATQGVTGTTVDALDAAGGVAQTLTGPVEALQGVAAAGATAPVESTQGVASTQTGQLDAAQALAAALVAPVEARGGITTSAVDQLDASQGVAATTGSAVVEALNGLAATLTGPLEATGGITSPATSILEALQGVAATGSDPIDAQGNTPVTATTAAVIEALQAISVPATGALDTVQTLTSTRQTAVEALASALATAGVPLEAAQAVAAAASVLPIETVAAVAITSQLPVEALQLVRAAVSAPLEAVAATPSGAEVPGSVSLSAAPFATVVLLARAFAQLTVSAQPGTIPGFGDSGFGVGGFGGVVTLATVTVAATPAAKVAVTAAAAAQVTLSARSG